MAQKFNKHYTREEARALLPLVRQWLEKLSGLRDRMRQCEPQVGVLMERESGGVGGEAVNAWVRAVADIRGVLIEFHGREILLKDIDRGLVDFPAIVGGREVFLCWEQGEEDIEFWHDLDAGYAGRERL